MDRINFKQFKEGQRAQSNVQWPASVSLSRDDNVSTDTHMSVEHAATVCRALEREGLGCEGKIFPLRTWVSPVDGEQK